MSTVTCLDPLVFLRGSLGLLLRKEPSTLPSMGSLPDVCAVGHLFGSLAEN